MQFKTKKNIDLSGGDLYPPGAIACPLTEMAFLNAILGCPRTTIERYTYIPQEAFYHSVRGAIWAHIKRGILATSQLYDLLTPKDSAVLTELLAHEEPRFDLDLWARQIISTHSMRQLNAIATRLEILSRDKTAVPDLVMQEVRESMGLITQMTTGVDQIATYPDALGSAIDQIAEISSKQIKPRPKWGWADLDLLTKGIQPGTMVTIGARPSMGKSTFALCAATNLADQEIPTLFITLEMPKEELAKKVFSRKKKISSLLYSDLEKISESTFNLMVDYYEEAMDFPLVFSELNTTSAADIEVQIEKATELLGQKVQVVFIDYLGLMNLDSDQQGNQAYAIAKLTRSLVTLARNRKVAIVLLSQLNRSVESRNDKRPLLSDLRDSGAIEQDSHAVILLYRDEYYNKGSELGGTTEVIVAKNRGGPTGVVNLVFDGEHSDFKSKLGFN